MTEFSRRDWIRTIGAAGAAGALGGIDSLHARPGTAGAVPATPLAVRDVYAPGDIVELYSTSEVFIPPRGRSWMKFSFDFPEPGVVFGDHRFSFLVFTDENTYSLDRALMRASGTDSALELTCTGLVWAGGQEKAPGSVIVRFRRLGRTIEWDIVAEAQHPIKTVTTVIRDIPRGQVSFGGGQLQDTRDGDATCSIRSGSAFPLYISIDSLPADAPQYEGFDLVVKYTGLTAQEDADAEVWPDCAFPAQFYDEGFIGIGCVIGVEPAGPSRYTGVIATSSFTCSQSGTISLVHSSKDTDVVETLGAIHGEGENTSEKLTISCDRGGAEAQEPEGGPRSQQPTQEPRAATQTAAAIEGTIQHRQRRFLLRNSTVHKNVIDFN